MITLQRFEEKPEGTLDNRKQKQNSGLCIGQCKVKIDVIRLTVLCHYVY